MSTDLLNIAPLDWTGLICAIASGAIIGLERQLIGKPVGIRTGALICVGAYIFVAIANIVADSTTDHSRIIGQIVTGVGFLGAGVMLVRDSIVVGATSAAAIWVLAAIGVTIGSGYPFSGIKLALLTIAILIGVNKLENSFKMFQRGVHQKFNRSRLQQRPGQPPIKRSGQIRHSKDRSPQREN